jgi:hypothetical protein
MALNRPSCFGAGTTVPENHNHESLSDSEGQTGFCCVSWWPAWVQTISLVTDEPSCIKQTPKHTAVGPYCSSILRARHRTIPSEHAHTLFVEADKLTQLRLIRLSAPPRGRLPPLLELTSDNLEHILLNKYLLLPSSSTMVYISLSLSLCSTPIQYLYRVW